VEKPKAAQVRISKRFSLHFVSNFLHCIIEIRWQILQKAQGSLIDLLDSARRKQTCLKTNHRHDKGYDKKSKTVVK